MEYRIYRSTIAPENVMPERADSQLEASLLAQKLSYLEPSIRFIVSDRDMNYLSSYLDGTYIQ
jgi:hypothetical protein